MTPILGALPRLWQSLFLISIDSYYSFKHCSVVRLIRSHGTNEGNFIIQASKKSVVWRVFGHSNRMAVWETQKRAFCELVNRAVENVREYFWLPAWARSLDLVNWSSSPILMVKPSSAIASHHSQQLNVFCFLFILVPTTNEIALQLKAAVIQLDEPFRHQVTRIPFFIHSIFYSISRDFHNSCPVTIHAFLILLIRRL